MGKEKRVLVHICLVAILCLLVSLFYVCIVLVGEIKGSTGEIKGKYTTSKGVVHKLKKTDIPLYDLMEHQVVKEEIERRVVKEYFIENGIKEPGVEEVKLQEQLIKQTLQIPWEVYIEQEGLNAQAVTNNVATRMMYEDYLASVIKDIHVTKEQVEQEYRKRKADYNYYEGKALFLVDPHSITELQSDVDKGYSYEEIKTKYETTERRSENFTQSFQGLKGVEKGESLEEGHMYSTNAQAPFQGCIEIRKSYIGLERKEVYKKVVDTLREEQGRAQVKRELAEYIAKIEIQIGGDIDEEGKE